MATEAKNTLQSEAIFKIIDVLSEGEIGGLVNGAKSVLLNGTPVENADGTVNFSGFDASTDIVEKTGTDSQEYLSGFPASEAETSVGVKVTKDSPEGSGSGDGSVVQTISSTTTDSVRVNLRLAGLARQNLSNGDLNGSSIEYDISVKGDGGTYQSIIGCNTWKGISSNETSDLATGLKLNVNMNGAWGVIEFLYEKWNGTAYDAPVRFGYMWVPYTDRYRYGTLTRSATPLSKCKYRISVTSDQVTPGVLQYYEFSSEPTKIEGKTTSPYDFSHVIRLSDYGNAPYDIKVSRITDDHTTTEYNDDLYWYSYTEIIDNKLEMPNTAAVGIRLKASTFGGAIPSRAYEILGRNTIKIPSNYDPLARTYTGTWDGTFHESWTDNPAWILYDMLTNKRYGLGEQISDASIDKWTLYSIAQYCDEYVPAPDGGQEPRYSINACINSESEAYDLINAIASAFRGMALWSSGTITASADMPTTATKLFTTGNVIDGIFNYSGSARKARHTAILVSWNNPKDNYKLNVELVEDSAGILEYGYRPLEINAYGCTSRGLAQRWGKWVLESEQYETEVVTFGAGFADADIVPGDIIKIQDPNFSQVELSGRLKEYDSTNKTITLDRQITLTSGKTYSVDVAMPNGSIDTHAISFSGTITTDIITLDTALADTPVTGGIWLVTASDLSPREFQVTSVVQNSKNTIKITALFYDPNKYARVETGLNYNSSTYTAYPSGFLPPPTGLSTEEFLYYSGNTIQSGVSLSWQVVDDPRVAFYQIEYKTSTGVWEKPEKNLVQDHSVSIKNTSVDIYTFRVRAQDSSGALLSSWAEITVSLLGKTAKPADITGFVSTIEKYGILLEWNAVSDIDIDYYEIRKGTDWGTGSVVASVKSTAYKYEDQTAGAYQFWIKAVDTSGNYSANATLANSSVLVQAKPAVVTKSVVSGIQLDISGAVTTRFSHYEVQRKLSPSGTVSTINSNVLTRIFTDSDITTLGYSSEWQYSVRAVDKNGDASDWSDWSTAISASQVQGKDITANQIVAKDFRTACNAGCVGSTITAGVIFNGGGMQAWNATEQTFSIDSATGDVSMKGTITATAGNIGGFTIDPTEGLYAGSGSTRVQMKTGAGFWAGATAQGDAPFSVNQAGALKARSGLIGNWGINSHQIYQYGEQGGVMYIGGNTGQAIIWLGANSGSNQITIGECIYNGSGWNPGHWGIVARFGGHDLFQVHACCDGTCQCAQIAGWNFNNQCLYNNNIIINSAGAIGTYDFTTGNKGWCISCTGDAEFNNIKARGAIHTAVFVKDEVSVIGGCTLIRPATTLTADATLATGSDTFYISDNTQFAVDDIIQIKDGAVSYWGTVTASNAGNIAVSYNSGTSSGVVTKGQAVVNHGNKNGCGGILLDGQTPYIDVYTHNGTPWAGTDSRVRIGNLNGVFGFSSDTYGIALGCSSGHHMTYDTVSNTLNLTGAINIQSGSSGLQNVTGFETVAGFNNFSISGNTCGYSGSGYIGCGLTTATKNGQTVCVMCLVANCNSFVYGPTFKIDPNTAYKFDFSVCGDSTTGTAYWGLYVYDCNGCNLSVTRVTPSTGVSGCNTSNFYWWSGNATSWRDMTGYLLPESIDAKDVPYGKNVNQHAKMPSNAYCMRIRFLNYYNSGTTSTKLFYSPTVSKVNIENSNATYRALRSDGTLKSRVIPACSASPSGSGLYLGNDYMGYYDGSGWKSYMNNSGHFYLSGTNGGLGWDGIDLTVCGTVCSWNGHMGGWCIANTKLYNYTDATHWICMDSSGSIAGNYSSTTGWCIGQDGNATFNNATLRGTVYANCGNVGAWDITNGNLYSQQTHCNDCGVFYFINGSATPELDIYHYCKSTCTQTSRVLYRGWLDGSSYSYAPFQVYSHGKYTAYFQDTVCMACLDTQYVDSSNFVLKGSASSGFWSNGYSGFCSAYAPLQIHVCCSTCYAMCTNGHIYAQAFNTPSDRALKCDFNDYDVLPKLRNVDIQAWKFKDSNLCRIGMMSQDFYSIFKGFSSDCTSVPLMDGIALKGVQELDDCNAKLEKQFKDLSLAFEVLNSRFERIAKAN